MLSVCLSVILSGIQKTNTHFVGYPVELISIILYICVTLICIPHIYFQRKFYLNHNMRTFQIFYVKDPCCCFHCRLIGYFLCFGTFIFLKDVTDMVLVEDALIYNAVIS